MFEAKLDQLADVRRDTKLSRIARADSALLRWVACSRGALALLVVGALALKPVNAAAQLHVVCWGSSNSGITNVPASLANVRSIAAGYNHCLALLSNGTVVAWGNNFNQQTNVPAGLTNVAAIAAGDTHSLALLSNGVIVARGDNNSGQLKMRILASVVYRLPFIVWSFLRPRLTLHLA
jgi:hypothetical protein